MGAGSGVGVGDNQTEAPMYVNTATCNHRGRGGWHASVGLNQKL